MVPASIGGRVGHSELWLCELHEDDGSVWDALEHAGRFAEELYAMLQVRTAVAEVPAARLRPSEARAFELHSTRGKPLARIACESDCCARYLGIRCGNKVMGQRQKAFCHSVGAVLALACDART